MTFSCFYKTNIIAVLLIARPLLSAMKNLEVFQINQKVTQNLRYFGLKAVICPFLEQSVNKLKFDSDIAIICQIKANQKFGLLSRLASLLTPDRKRIIFKAIFESQFKYCPLICMFCSRRASISINKLYEQAITKPSSPTCSHQIVRLLSIIQIFNCSYLKCIK